MRYFHYYYEIGIKSKFITSKFGIGVLEVKEIQDVNKTKYIQEIERKLKVKVTKFELKEINHSEFESLYMITRGRNYPTSSELSFS